MTIVVKKNKTRSELDKELIRFRKKHRRINLDKYFGKINFGISGLEYQKKIRNEWR